MEQKLDLFAVLKDINFKKTYALHKHSGFDKAYDAFMINRYLSMGCETVFEANFMNMCGNLPKHVKYLFLSDVIERKDRFLKYIKADKDKEDQKMVKYVQQLYEVNKDVAQSILQTIDEDEKAMIKNCFTMKTIRKR